MFLGGGGAEMTSRPFAEQTQAAIDAEVARLLREAERRATELLKEHREHLDRLTRLLIEQETVDGSAVYALVGAPEVPESPAGWPWPRTGARRGPRPAARSSRGSSQWHARHWHGRVGRTEPAG